MIRTRSEREIRKMRAAGQLAARLLKWLEPQVQVGVTTGQLDAAAERYTREHGAVSAPLNYKGFPKSICTSVNSVVCHGIPADDRELRDGDVVNVDVTVILDGYHGDTSRTFILGQVPDSTRLLVDRAERALYVGIQQVRPGAAFGRIGEAIEAYVNRFGYSVVREYGGHGIGRKFHEEPFVPHFKRLSPGPVMRPGMTFTIEPMINEGASDVYLDRSDGWTVYTRDGSLSAQFEHTVLVTDEGVEILTRA